MLVAMAVIGDDVGGPCRLAEAVVDQVSRVSAICQLFVRIEGGRQAKERSQQSSAISVRDPGSASREQLAGDRIGL
jgi:hypothetical protein